MIRLHPRLESPKIISYQLETSNLTILFFQNNWRENSNFCHGSAFIIHHHWSRSIRNFIDEFYFFRSVFWKIEGYFDFTENFFHKLIPIFLRLILFVLFCCVNQLYPRLSCKFCVFEFVLCEKWTWWFFFQKLLFFNIIFSLIIILLLETLSFFF